MTEGLTGRTGSEKMSSNEWLQLYEAAVDDLRSANVDIASSFLNGRQPGQYPLSTLLIAQARADNAGAMLDCLLADWPEFAARVNEPLEQKASKEVADDSQRLLRPTFVQKIANFLSTS